MNDRFLAFAEALDAYTRKSDEVISRLDNHIQQLENRLKNF